MKRWNEEKWGCEGDVLREDGREWRVGSVRKRGEKRKPLSSPSSVI